jgi:hypothetical protein
MERDNGSAVTHAELGPRQLPTVGNLEDRGRKHSACCPFWSDHAATQGDVAGPAFEDSRGHLEETLVPGLTNRIDL